VGIFPKKEIDHKVVEHVVVFLNVVTECNQLSSFLRYVPNKTVGTFYHNQQNGHNIRKFGHENRKQSKRIRIVSILAMIFKWLCSGFRVHLQIEDKLRKLL
jgi:hypothetical protein